MCLNSDTVLYVQTIVAVVFVMLFGTHCHSLYVIVDDNGWLKVCPTSVVFVTPAQVIYFLFDSIEAIDYVV